MTVAFDAGPGVPPVGNGATPASLAQQILSLHGEYDTANALALHSLIGSSIADGGGDLVLELGEVEFMDASTIAVLADTNTTLRRSARALRLRSPSTMGRRLLEICSLDHLIDPISDPIVPSRR